MVLVKELERFEGVSFVLLAPQSTLMTDTLLTTLTVHRHLLVMDIAFLLLRRGRDGHFLLDSMKVIQHLSPNIE